MGPVRPDVPLQPAPSATPSADRSQATATAPAPRSSHVRVRTAHDRMEQVAVDLKVDEVPDHGLRFFALQVNFGDGAGAHGGPQAMPGEGRANWGGLSKYGYQYQGHELEALQQIQNLPGRTHEADWQADTWYTLKATRGPQTTLPPGKYSVLDEDPTDVPFARDMYRWDFTIEPRGGGLPVFTQSLYAASDAIDSFTYWTETGYGMECDDKLSAYFEQPRYTDSDSGRQFRPVMMAKSLYQSDCGDHATSDMHTYNEPALGVHMVYGGPRDPSSHSGQVMYVNRPGPIDPDPATMTDQPDQSAATEQHRH